MGMIIIIIINLLSLADSNPSDNNQATSPLDSLPPGLFIAVQNAGDRIVSKASQLVENYTSNICENFMSILGKMGRGRYSIEFKEGHFSIGQWLLHSDYSLDQVGLVNCGSVRLVN